MLLTTPLTSLRIHPFIHSFTHSFNKREHDQDRRHPCPLGAFSGVYNIVFEDFIFKKDFIYLFLERGKRQEKEERNITWLPLACTSGMCPNGVEPATFLFAGNAQPTEPHELGLEDSIFI